jgi:hypothetical protein
VNCKSCRCPHSPILRNPISSPPSSNFSKSETPALCVTSSLFHLSDRCQTGSQKPQNRPCSCINHSTTRRVSVFSRQFVRPCFSFLAVPVHNIGRCLHSTARSRRKRDEPLHSFKPWFANEPPTHMDPTQLQRILLRLGLLLHCAIPTGTKWQRQWQSPTHPTFCQGKHPG